MLKDITLFGVFLPGDAKYVSEALEMKTVEVCCELFATVEQGA